MESFLARKTEDGRYQTLTEHLNNVSRFCEEISSKFTDKRIGRFIGEIHDIGKYSEEFQKRLEDNSVRVDHATAGAVECLKISEDFNNPFYKLMASVVCAHHSGLQDYGVENSSYSTVARRCKEYSINYRANYLLGNKGQVNTVPAEGLASEFKREKQKLKVTLYNYTRFLYSSLIDSDRLDAEFFTEEFKSEIRNKSLGFSELKGIFDVYMNQIASSSRKNEKVNRIRNSILLECLKSSEKERGMYTLNVPTGGGKTLSSMAFALNHLEKNKMDRIIYSIPFTSIIEQNSEVFANIFGRENILEHHSQFYSPFEGSDPRGMKLELAAENWDMPLVVTTNVQFFESFFSKEAKRCRKLHNIANSIIILDEVQSIPFNYLKPCMEIVGDLVKSYGCTVVLCSATQMDFEKQSIIPEDVEIKNIISNPELLREQMKRVEFEFVGKKNLEQVSEEISRYSQSLTIVNTKKHAIELFKKIKEQENSYCLTTNIYPQERKRKIKEIKELLSNNEPVTVISTQLIEAGVDVDFPAVFRAISGIDSIVQAGGRCNREGKRDTGKCYIFEPEEEFWGKGYLNNTATVALSTINKFGNEFISDQAIQHYYSELIGLNPERVDDKDIMTLIRDGANNFEFQFEEISKRFKLIEDTGYPVVIMTDESIKLLKNIIFKVKYKDSIRKLALYTVNVNPYLFNKLKESMAITFENDMFYVLTKEDIYKKDIGLYLDSEDGDGMEIYIF